MVEMDIHCNVIKCRKPLSLESQACVTSCSHIFCIGCSNQLFSKVLVCPACNTNLSGNDDIIVTELNPTEEFKSSILSGLKPEIILDICTRAVAFYEYQTSQEILYRAMMQKNIEDKYHNLKDQFNIATRDLNHIIKTEKEKHLAIMKDLELEKVKSQQAFQKLDEKSKQFQKLQLMYEKLKRKAIAPNMQQQRRHLQIEPEHPMITYNTRNDDVASKIGQHPPINKTSHYMPFQKRASSPSVVYPLSNAPTSRYNVNRSIPLPSFNHRRLTHMKPQ